jgi:hypothetical protein
MRKYMLPTPPSPPAIILTHPMRLRRRFPILFGLLIVLAVLAAVVYLRKHAPPEPARLLPGADGFVYMNLQWMRRADFGSHPSLVQHDPDYDKFIQATGFDFERDLAQAAFAIHYASPATRGQTRFSEILVAHLDGNKLRDYLKTTATSIENHRSIAIYNISLESRTLRVAVLGVNVCTPHLCTMVAASNHDDPQIIRSMIDRSRKIASPFGGPALLRQYYKYVPQLPLPSLGWAIFKLGPSASALNAFPLSAPATVVASVRYLGAVHFRAEAFTKDEQSAEQLTSRAGTYLAVFHGAEVSVGGQTPDPDLKRALDSLKVEQDRDRAVLSAIIPLDLIRKIVAEAPEKLSPR